MLSKHTPDLMSAASVECWYLQHGTVSAKACAISRVKVLPQGGMSDADEFGCNTFPTATSVAPPRTATQHTPLTQGISLKDSRESVSKVRQPHATPPALTVIITDSNGERFHTVVCSRVVVPLLVRTLLVAKLAPSRAGTLTDRRGPCGTTRMLVMSIVGISMSNRLSTPFASSL